MNDSHESESRLSGLCAGAAAVVAAVVFTLASASAHAQTAPNPTSSAGSELEEVVVTGTLLRGVTAPVGSAIVSLDQNAIADTGYSTTADVIRSLPFVSQIGAGEETTNSSANIGTLNITHANGINLRGLGDQATLILLDGRRLPPGGEGAQLFDPSSIPAIALQRIDVMPDGASATYGSDAVAGVVNLILRKDFNGAEIEASDGFAKDFDGQWKVSTILGHTWDSGSVMIAAEFFSHPHLLADSRPSLYNDNQTAYGGSDLRYQVGAPGNITYNGQLYGLPPGNGVGVTPADFSTTINKTSQWADTDAIPSENRHSAVLSARQEITDKISVWAEGYYTDRTGVLNNGVVYKTGIEVPSTNPFYIAAAATPCSPGSAALCDSVNYAFTNDMPWGTRTDSETAHQVALGFDFDLGHDFHFAIYGTTSQDKEEDFINHQINADGLTAALADPNPATALNVFGSGGNNNPATMAMIDSFTSQSSRYDLNLLNAKIDGPVYDLPGGPILMALGGEFHHDSLNNYNYSNNDTTSTQITNVTVDVTNSRTVASGYTEIQVPIFSEKNAMPGLQHLVLDVAGRYDHYSDFGGTTNPKFGLRWDPTDDFTTQASFGKSFRAPNLCDINPLCTSTVLTIPFPDLGWAKDKPPSIFGPGTSVTSIILGGNSDLRPETATTYSLGGDFHPQAVRGLDVTLDYYHIDYRNIIDTPAAFNPAAGFDPAYASFVIRNPTVAQVLAVYGRPLAGPQGFPPFLVNLIVNGTRQNVGEAITNGFDLGVKYQWDTGFGKWNTGLNTTYVLKYDYQLVPGAAIINQLNNVQGSGNAYPLRFTARGQLGWRDFGFNVTGFVNFHNSYTNTAPPSPLPPERIDSYTTVDLTAGYDTGDRPDWKGLHNIVVSLSAINVFNRLPPFALVGTQEFDSTTGGPLGRLLTIDLKKRF